jgi:hypothetical protein
MYLFTRMARLAPAHYRDGIEWAHGLTEKVNQITSLNVGVWSPIISPGLGTLSWGCAVETLSDLEDADAKLMADPMYLDAVEKGSAMLIGTVEDQTAQFLHNPPQTGETSHVMVVESALANGSFKRGVEVGIEIAQRATDLGGLPTAFLMGVTGTYAGCAWITSATSLRDLERGEQAVNGDMDFIGFLDKEAPGCFLPGVTKQAIWRRLV